MTGMSDAYRFVAAQSGEVIMIDQSVHLAIGMTAQLYAFAINFALTGNLPYALDVLAGSQQAKQDNQVEIDNLFWD